MAFGGGVKMRRPQFEIKIEASNRRSDWYLCRLVSSFMKHKVFMSNGILFLIGLLAADFVGAQAADKIQPSRYADSKYQVLDVKKAMVAAAEITTAKYPDSDDATVEKKMVREYRADGTGESQDETFTKVAGIGAQPDEVHLELMQPDIGRDIERDKGFL